MRLFPVIQNLDYNLVRAQAWLSAIQKAGEQLEPAARENLAGLGLDPVLAASALAAALYYPAYVTPENSQERMVSVSLGLRDGPNLTELLKNPGQVAEKMALIFQMRRKMQEMTDLWPQNVLDSAHKLASLENLSAILSEYWGLLNSLDAENVSHTARILADDPVALLKLASLQLTQGLVQACLGTAEQALALCQRQSAEARWPGVWEALQARIYYLLGRAHWLASQPGMASADFNAALGILRNNGAVDPLLTEILVSAGELALERSEYNDMCSYFQEACSLGQCQNLATQKRNGHCQ